MDGEQHAPSSAKPDDKRADFQPMIDAISPHLADLSASMIGNAREAHRNNLWLLGGLVMVLGSLAGIALVMGANDTAEKIVIALASFLSGAGLFGGGKK